MDKETNVLSEEERLSARIEEILAKINSDPNPEELENLKKIIKKKVPFTRRSYFAAMLLKMLTSQPERRERAPREKKREFAKKENTKELEKKEKETVAKEAKPEKALPEDAKTLYLNIGKMKHLYGKDLSKLLQAELSITRDDIYSLRVHDKYSFITMSEANCTKAIEKLNGRDINGRTAQLNFSNR